MRKIVQKWSKFGHFRGFGDQMCTQCAHLHLTRVWLYSLFCRSKIRSKIPETQIVQKCHKNVTKWSKIDENWSKLMKIIKNCQKSIIFGQKVVGFGSTPETPGISGDFGGVSEAKMTPKYTLLNNYFHDCTTRFCPPLKPGRKLGAFWGHFGPILDHFGHFLCPTGKLRKNRGFWGVFW